MADGQCQSRQCSAHQMEVATESGSLQGLGLRDQPEADPQRVR